MNNRIISGISTAVIMAIVAVILMAFGYDPPDPPIPEEGVEVNIGDSDFGSGDSPEPDNQVSTYAPPAAQQQMATQTTEPTPSLNASQNQGATVNPQAQEQPVVENKEPEINRNALFTGRRNQQSGSGSQGVSQGTGDQGRPNGTPTSDNYTGTGGKGNYNLAGRSAVTLPQPAYNSNKQGKVVVKIWVNPQGEVIRAEYQPKCSNTSDGELVNKAVAAARKARFNADSKAAEEQGGTITYNFVIK